MDVAANFSAASHACLVRPALRVGIGTAGGVSIGEYIRQLGKRALPPFPGPDLINPVIAPAPKPIPINTCANEATCICLNAYSAAVESRWPEKRFRAAYKRDSKNWQIVQAAAQHLQALQVPPVSWCLFSIDCYRRIVEKKSRPTASWVFSLKRIEERMGWFESERDQYSGGQSFFAREHLALVEKWRAMWMHLVRAMPNTRHELLEIIDIYFPNDSFERELRAARYGAALMQKQVDEIINSHGCLY